MVSQSVHFDHIHIMKAVLFLLAICMYVGIDKTQDS